MLAFSHSFLVKLLKKNIDLLFFMALLFISKASFAIETPGSIDGQVSVQPDGSSAYSIPLKTPPGTAGVEPKISLTYNSRGGASPYGFGWGVSGVSAIQRGARNLAEDGTVRGVRLDKEDAIFLDGSKLVLVSIDKQGIKEYRTRIDNYSRIKAYEWNENGPTRFIVETRAGLKLFFGSTEASRVNVVMGDGTLIWLCDRIEDSVGNYMIFSYLIQGLDYRISEISYTGNENAKLKPYAKVSFEYKSVSPYDLKYIYGTKVQQNTELQQIVTSFRGKILRRYVPKFERIDQYRGFQKLVGLKESGEDGLSYKPTRFDYSIASSGWREENANYPTEVLSTPGKKSFEFLNFQGGVEQELLFSFSENDQVKGGAYEFKNGAYSLLDKKWAPPFLLNEQTHKFVDLNEDGYMDIFTLGDFSYISDSSSGWKAIPNKNIDTLKELNKNSSFLFLKMKLENVDRKVLLWSSRKQKSLSGAAVLIDNQWQSLPKSPRSNSTKAIGGL